MRERGECDMLLEGALPQNAEPPQINQPRCNMKKITDKSLSSTPENQPLLVDDTWRVVVEPITLLKDAVDRVRDAEGHEIAIRIDDRARLAAHNINADELRKFDKEGAGVLTEPISFVQLIMGPFIGTYESKIWQVRAPSWSVLGWQFKHLNKSLSQEASPREYMEKVIEASPVKATASCFGGIPLFISGEGKNRCSFHHQHELSQLVGIRLGPYPDARVLRLQSVAFVSDFVALHCYQNGQKITALLPFPKLSIPLLEAHGVQKTPSTWFGLFWPWTTILTNKRTKWRIPQHKRLAIACGLLSLRDRLFIGH